MNYPKIHTEELVVTQENGYNIIGDEFRNRLVYNGPPETCSAVPIFNIASSMNLERAIIWALEDCGSRLFDHITNPSKNVMFAVCVLNPRYMEKLQEHFTEADLTYLVQRNSAILCHIKDPSAEMIYHAVCHNCEMIKYVTPKHLHEWHDTGKIDELVATLIRRRVHPYELRSFYIRTPALSEYIRTQVLLYGDYFDLLSEADLTTEFLATLPKVSVGGLRWLANRHPELLTEALVDLCFTSNVYCYRYLPKHYRTLERSRKVVSKQKDLLCEVPECYRVSEVLDTPKIQHWDRIKDAFLTPLVIKLVEGLSGPKKGRFAFVSQCTEAECLELLRYFPRSLAFMTDKQKTYEVCKTAIEIEPWTIEHAGTWFDELYPIALAREPRVVKYAKLPTSETKI